MSCLSVQTCLKRIRLDMPLTHEDYAGEDAETDISRCPAVRRVCCQTDAGLEATRHKIAVFMLTRPHFSSVMVLLQVTARQLRNRTSLWIQSRLTAQASPMTCRDWSTPPRGRLAPRPLPTPLLPPP